MKHLSEDDLLGLVRGELPPGEAREVEDHAAACPGCRRELAWLRTERGLFRAQPVPLPAHTWQGIERRIIIAREQKTERRKRAFYGGGAAAVFAAAAGLLVYVWGRGVPVNDSKPALATPVNGETPAREARPASEVLDDAERESLAAIAKLESAYASERDRFDPDVAERYDDEIQQLREVVVSERAAAGDDPWARRRVLRAYSAYMRSMQAMLLEVPK